MAKDRLSGKLAVILHADVAGSTGLVRQDEHVAHERIQETFHRFGGTITEYHGHVRELRGDALLAEFERASEALSASLAFQANHIEYIASLNDSIRPKVRVGIAMGEVVIADDTITGEGVVLAQRLEQLAEPGGVVIQAAAYETIPGRFPFAYTDLGEHEVKGFDKPVRAYSASPKKDTDLPPPEQTEHRYRNTLIALASIVVAVGIGLMWFEPWEVREEPASIERMAFPLPDKPSIAVLPLINMSDDKSQEYFADGMTEDLITDLSNISGLFVIARTSSFLYKGQQLEVRQVAEELGVRYVLEGSVRRAGDQVRINAQLIDATTGGHLWAERYDGSLTDVFGLQDKVVAQIVKALAVNLGTTELTRAGGTETGNPAAYDAVLQGWNFIRKRTPEDFARAITYFEKALELDPGYNRANAGLATVYWYLVDYGWEAQLGMNYQAGDLASENLTKALAQPTADAYRISAEMQVSLGEKGEALAEIDRAIALEPNNADNLSSRAWILLVSGRAEEAEEDARRAVRLDPANPRNIEVLARAMFHQEHYEKAIENYERVVNTQPNLEYIYNDLAMAYAFLGRIEEAKAAILKRNAPDQTLQGYEGWWEGQYDFDRIYLNQMVEGLRLAGVPSGVTKAPAEVNYKDLVTKSAGTFDVEGAIKIEAAGAKTLHERGIAFIDNRGSRQYKRGHIPGATNLLFGSKLTRDNLSQVVNLNDEIVFYCGGLDCHLSPYACAQTLTWGYTKVYYFAGGFPAWKKAGYPVEVL
jgi:adenylate cyclase